MSYPYYRFFPGDYLRDTRRLTLLQHGAYHLLIHEYMASGKPLRGDLASICRICGAFSGEEQKAVEYCLIEFFKMDGPLWRHKRCDAELEKLGERSASARESANRRWSEKTDANAMRTHYDGNANQNQNQNQNQITTKATATPKAPVAALPTPAGVQVETWKAYREHRRARRSPLTPSIEGVVVAKLCKLVASGQDAELVVRQSIERGWTSVFPVDQEPRRGKQPTLAESRKANMDKLCGGGNGHTGSVDAAPVFAVAGHLRKPYGDDVG